MERREAPGVCETPSTPLGERGVPRADEIGFARPNPRRARPATAGWRDQPPGRCASRRSTAAPHEEAPRLGSLGDAS